MSKRILPLKMVLGMNILKEYIKNNKVVLIQHGIQYLLCNKEIILNFNLDELDELDDENNDNISRRQCLDNITNTKKKD